MEKGWALTPDACDKQEARRRMRAMRLVADQKQGPDAALAIARIGVDERTRLGIGPGVVVAGYWPIDTEVDVRPLLARLRAEGAVCALPAIAPDDALVFRRWDPTVDPVQDGPLGTSEPTSDRPEVRPDVVFAPMLAVDDGGARLGLGFGYYDRAIRRLRAEGPVVVVAVGYAVQRVAALPHDDGDEPVDWVLSEHGLERPAGASRS